MILQLHKGETPEAVRKQLVRLLGQVPYNDVVAVEQELINEGLPQEEVLKLCDIHTEALRGAIDLEGAKVPSPGHPVNTFQQENSALMREIHRLNDAYKTIGETSDEETLKEALDEIRSRFNALADVEKHYMRKENLLFPFLEKHGINGPPQVMWGKHNETRALLKEVFRVLEKGDGPTAAEAASAVESVFKPASHSIEEMISKEENILFPMAMDTLAEEEWVEIYRQGPEIGFCLYDPQETWEPEGIAQSEEAGEGKGRIRFPSGSMTAAELTAVLNTIPFDLTFVDKEDTVRFFTQGKERIFARNRAIIGRKVQRCHPPSSVHVVGKILDDFKSGKKDQASFWIQKQGLFIMIEYYALRSPDGEYLGTLEVSQDLTEKRKLEGEQRLPASDKK